MHKILINKAPIIAALFISILSLIGWLTDRATLDALLPGIADMTLNTTLCFLLLILVCLHLSFCNHQQQPIRNKLALLASIIIIIFAMLSLLQDIFLVHFGIDNLFLEPHNHNLTSPYPGRMSPATALGFLLSGFLSFSLATHKALKSFDVIFHISILLIGAFALIGIGMNILMPKTPDTYAHFSSMSMFTSITFLLLSISFLSLYQRKFIKANPILHSGIHLMYRLKYPQKFTLISVIFIVPLSILMWDEIRSGEQHVALAQLKIHGIEHIHLTSKLSKAIPEHRGMTNTSFSNPNVFQEGLLQKTKQIDQLFKDSAQMDLQHNKDVILNEGMKEAYALWRSIKENKMNQVQQWQAHTAIIALLARHMRNTGEESRLVFEEDTTLHYLLTMQLNIMPDLFENIGKLRGQGASFLPQQTLSKEGQLLLATMNGQVELQLRALERVSKRLITSQEKLGKLNDLLAAFTRQTRIFIRVTEQGLITSSSPAMTSDAYFQYATLAIEKGYVFNNASLKYITQRLHNRIINNTTSQYNIKLVAMLMLLLLLFLFASFYKSVINTIQALDNTAKQMRDGQPNQPIALLAKDELGHVANAFNTIAEELMRVSSHMSAVVEHAVDGIITIDKNGIIKSFNPAAEDIFGYLQDAVVEKNITMLMPEQYRKAHQEGLRHYCEAQQGEIVGTGSAIEVRGLKKDGSEFPMELSINTMVIDEQQMFIGMVRDISEHRELEQQFRHAQKMQAVGILVGGVAHNFNNLLAGIVGKAYIGKAKVQSDLQVIPYFDAIADISHQAGDMVKQLLAFSHKDFSQDKRNTALAIIIKKAFATAELGIEENIELSLHIIDDGMTIHCDASQIQQVLMNMMNNARDAVAGCDKKCIRVSLEKCTPSPQFFHKYPKLKPNAYALLRISDNGHGMDEETMEKVFDPFFTSKAVGKGTGLGLSSAFGSISSHDGVIEVDSHITEGTTFSVYLPLVTAVKSTPDNENKPTVAGQGHELLLLVDDEELIVQSMQEVLESLGYKVITANDGVQGLKCFTEHQHEITAVLTDVIMPEMGGVEMFRKIRQINPCLPTMFITGYDQGNVNLQGDEKENTMVISKPIQISALSHKIQQLLATTSNPS